MKMNRNRFRNYTRLMLISLVIIPGMIIGIWSILSVSEQKRARELKLEESYLSNLHKLANEIEINFENSLQSTLKQATSYPLPIDNRAQVQQVLKEILLKNRVAIYPFIIDETGQFIFPFQGTWQMVMTPTIHVFHDNVIEKHFNRGEELELKERDMMGAIREYIQCLNSKDKQTSELKPYFYNAIGRCYYKQGKFPQAITYYQMVISNVLGSPSNKKPTDYSLYIPALRQLAQCFQQLGLTEQTTRIYLALYETILQYESSHEQEQYTLFKNEALDYLNANLKESKKSQSPGETRLTEEQRRFNRARLQDRIDNDSMLDISLRWSFFDDMDVSREKDDVQRFSIIREFYLSTDRKTQFYKAVKQFTGWEQRVKYKVIKNHTGLPKYEIAWIQLKSDLKNKLFFGFMISPDFFGEEEFKKITGKYFNEPELTVYFLDRDAVVNNSLVDNRGYRLFTASFRNIPVDNVLALYSKTPDFLPRLARQEIYYNYLLLGAFTLLLILGVLFFYKYQAREAELIRLKSEFTDRASHTLKTPLTRIRMLAEKLSLGWVMDENKKNEYLQTILSETDRMNEMITDMLDFSKIEAGKKQYSMEYGSLTETIREIIESYIAYIQSRGFRLELEIDDTVPPVLFDKDAIRLIITNLLHNGVKYSREDKYLHVRFYSDAVNAILEIIDHGVGIDKNEQEKIFQPYYRVSEDYVKSVEGSGLGLYLVYHAIRAHNGTISVKSNPGKGSCFTVSIPIIRSNLGNIKEG